jgi:lipopolysaccharide heptosyltransferase I
MRCGRSCKMAAVRRVTMSEPGERYLIVRLTALGDILHTLPAVAALRASHPDARIDWVVERKWAPVLEGSPAIDDVIPFDRRSVWGAVECVKRLREGKYACAIDFQGLYKSSILAALSGAGRRIGFDRGWAREPGSAMFHTERVIPAGRHVAELNYSLAEHAGASRPAAPEYPLRVPAGGAASIRARLRDLGIAGEYIVVGPGGSWRAKCWPAERFGDFCREFEKQNDLRVVVIRGPGEERLAEEVCRVAAPARPVVMAPTIEELMGLLAHARCVIAVDSGPLHLAAALGAPVAGLYGPTDPARNGPFAPGAVIVHKARPDEISYKRRAEYSAAMLRITVADVLAATAELLKAPR